MKRLLQLSALVLVFVFSCVKEEPVMYKLTVKTQTGGSVSTIGGEFESGSTVTITATPDAEYEFTGWSNGSKDNPITITLESHQTLQASFTKKKYSLNITVEGEGTVTEEIVSTGKDYDSGTKVKLTAVPSQGWELSKWSGDIDSTEESIEVTISQAKNIIVTFTKKLYDLTVNIVGEGEVNEKIITTGKTTQYEYQTTVELTTIPQEGWRFKEWSGDVTGTATQTQITVSDSKTVTATFERLYPLTINIVGEGEVTEEIVTTTGKTTNYVDGTTIQLSATPKDGWQFKQWTGDITGTATQTQIIVSDSKSVTATFELQYYTAKFVPISNSPQDWNLVTHSFNYQQSDKEYFLGGGVNWNDPTHSRPPLIRMIRREDNWEVINNYDEVDMSEIRNHEFSSDGKSFIICETGPEWPDIEWPFSNVYIGNLEGDAIKWTRVSKNLSFYHDASFGDINNDGITDVVGGHLGTRNGNNDNPHVYFGKSDGTFVETPNILPTAPEGGCCGDVEIYDLNGNGKNEIIRIGGYWENEIFDLLEYEEETSSFKVVYSLNKLIPDNPVTETYDSLKFSGSNTSGFKGYMPTEKRFHDFNNDGNIDFINEKDGLTIWYGDGNMNFTPMRLNKQAEDSTGLGIWETYYPMSGQNYFDIENDGDVDIVTRHFTLGNPNYNDGINLENMIYINDNGTFKRLNTSKYVVSNEDVKNNYPGSMFIPFLRNGKLCFMGATHHNDGSGPKKVMLEIETNIPASYWYEK